MNEPIARSKWKRRPRKLLKLGLLLLLGAIINVAVAWGCLYFFPPIWDGLYYSPHAQLTDDESTALLVPWFGDVIAAKRGGAYGERFWRIGWEISDTTWSPDEQNDKKHWESIDVQRTRAGFPFLALEGTSLLDVRSADFHERIVGGWLVRGQGLWRILPLRPIFIGFAINTNFYAAIVWLLFFATFKLRRSRRIRRGLCPACAYPVGTSDKCTECGKPVIPRSVEPAT